VLCVLHFVAFFFPTRRASYLAVVTAPFFPALLSSQLPLIGGNLIPTTQLLIGE
jgi:hypothetical protein